jgi:hypothetical protein
VDVSIVVYYAVIDVNVYDAIIYDDKLMNIVEYVKGI